MNEPRDIVDLLKEYANIRIFHSDTFKRARLLMNNSALEIERLRAALKVAEAARSALSADAQRKAT